MNYRRILYAFLFFILIGIIVLIEFLFIVNTTYRYKEYCNDDLPIQIEKYHHNDDKKHDETSPLFTLQSSCHVFSETYYDARKRFRHIVKTLQKSVESNINNGMMNHVTLDQKIVLAFRKESSKHNNNNDNDHHETNIDNDTNNNHYTMDIAVLHGTKPGLIIHVSGVHGVEGYAGSAIQITFLQILLHLLNTTNNTEVNDDASTMIPLPTIILIHSFNPYGMATYRRTNENNIDLNRNALTIEQWNTYAVNHYNKESYHQLDQSFFNPIHNVKPTFIYAYIIYWYKASYALIKYGIPQLKAAMVGGQYHNPYGIFYGGGMNNNHHLNNNNQRVIVDDDNNNNNIKIESSIVVLQNWLNEFRTNYTHLFTNPNTAITWIDVHTGLGPLGYDTILPISNQLISQNYFTNQIEIWFQKKEDSNVVVNSEGTTIPVNHKEQSVQQGYEQLQGLVIDYYYRNYFSNHINALFFAQEFGTVPTPIVGHAMIIENIAYQYYYNQYMNKECHKFSQDDDCYIQWLEVFQQKYLYWSKQMTLPAFYPQNQEWRIKILQNGIRILLQSIHRTIHLSSNTSSSSTNDSSISSSNTNTTTSLLPETTSTDGQKIVFSESNDNIVNDGTSSDIIDESFDTKSNHEEL